jgi:hypothetical protein
MIFIKIITSSNLYRNFFLRNEAITLRTD